MRCTVTFVILFALFATPVLAQEGCLTEDMVARWKTPRHPFPRRQLSLCNGDN